MDSSSGNCASIQEIVMRTVAIIMGGTCALLSPLAAGPGSPPRAADVPSYFKEIVGTQAATPAEIATKNILQLNTTMFELYGDAGQVFRKNILAEHPIILGMFSGAGGRFILYRPGMAPIDAPSVPIVYQLLKSVGHSTMALAVVVAPYLNSPNDLSWRGSLAAYRNRMQSALDSLDATPMRDDWRPNNRSILRNNIAFMDECLENNAISPEALQEFAKKQGPLLKKNIGWAAQTQVAHWMDVIAGWKQMLGADWNKTYAASNTIYVARQNNILFSVLAQFFGPQAINDRLILIETISFTTTPEEMLESLTRIISDRSVGAAFFGNYYLMDHELMGGWRRRLRTARSGRGGCAHAGGGRGRWSGLSANSACLLEEAFPFPPQLKAPPSVCRFAVPPGRQSELPGLDQDVATTQRALEAVQGIEDVIHLFPFRSVGLPEFRHSGL